jgi:hypothetical protein
MIGTPFFIPGLCIVCHGCGIDMPAAVARQKLGELGEKILRGLFCNGKFPFPLSLEQQQQQVLQHCSYGIVYAKLLRPFLLCCCSVRFH